MKRRTFLRSSAALAAVPLLRATPPGAPSAPGASHAPLRVKGARLKRIDDSAHFIMWDQPALFQSEVKTFLGKN